MRIIVIALIFMRFLQTVGYIALFHFSLIELKEPKKKRIAITAVVYLIVLIAYSMLMYFFGQKFVEHLIMPFEIGLCLILLLLCSADKWRASLFVTFSQFNFMFGISYIADIYASGSPIITYQIKYIVIRTVLFGALLIFNFKYLRPRFRKLVNLIGKEWYLITLTSFLFYILEAAIQYIPRMYWYETNNRWHLVVSSYLLFLSVYWLIFQSIVAIVNKFELQERERILAQQNKIWEEQIEEQRNAVNHARRDRHDLHHHYETLLTMLESGETKDAVSYLNEQTQRIEGYDLSGICEHPAANAILSRWKARAKELGIKTQMDVRIPANLPMDSVALVGILANAFENAVEGSLRCTDRSVRYINVKVAYFIYHEVGKLHIVFENACAEGIVIDNNLPQSQKSGGGTGTKSIAYLAEKYKGFVDYRVLEGVFTMRVLLHL